MIVYIMTDMEGVAGVVNSDDYARPDSRLYEVACELTTLETNAAIEGFLAAGATEFLVADGHGWGAINPRLLHPAAKLLTGRPLAYPFGCDETFDAACQIGQHAKSNADGGHLSHTGGFVIEDFTINGRSMGEMGCNMLFCSYYKVPTILLSGDLAAAEEARDLVPGIETVVVKEGWKRGTATGLTGPENKLFNGAAVHLSPTVARERIREGAERALRRYREVPLFWLDPPYELRSVARPEQSGGPTRTSVARGDDMIALLNAPRRPE
ncbi:MAG: M55 family metallopeptidase [Armatimonadetes bacterium]|nr:M55 family metallopeptidase [Armatimonadota bacterium]